MTAHDLARFVTLAALLCAAGACSSVRTVYHQAGYSTNGADTIKRVSVVAWTPPGLEAVAQVLARVGTDIVKLRKDYLVKSSGRLTRGWSDQCEEGRDGVLTLHLLALTQQDDEVSLDVSAELHRCADGALVWRADGDAQSESSDEALANMVGVYAQELGEAAKRLAAPAFVVLQDVLETLPNPVLSDDDVMEKIELE